MFIRPPGISHVAFQPRMDNISFKFCNLLLLFEIHTKTDTGMQQHECAFVSVLEEYQGPRKAGHVLHILHILHIMHIMHVLHVLQHHILLSDLFLLNFCIARVDRCQTTIVYQRKETAQMLYVFQCPAYWDDSLQTGTIPFDMRRESAIFPGLSVIKQKTEVTVVGGGTSTAGPWDGEPNNSGKNN